MTDLTCIVCGETKQPHQMMGRVGSGAPICVSCHLQLMHEDSLYTEKWKEMEGRKRGPCLKWIKAIARVIRRAQ
jgi:hypothetical protein